MGKITMQKDNTKSEKATEITLFDEKDAGKPYIIYDNKVISVEGFKHPGPQKFITDNLGKDVTTLFDETGHSAAALEMIKTMTIGTVPGSEGTEGKLLENKYVKVSREEKELHDKLDSLIDIKKPLIPQVKNLTNAEFKAFVKRPRFIADEDGIQLFESKDEDEKFKTYFEQNVIVLGGYIVFCLTNAYLDCPTTADFLWKLPVQFVFGTVLAWTFVEYFFHRFLLHNELHLDDNEKADPEHLAQIFAKHIYHHVFMNQRYRIAQPIMRLAVY